MNNLETEVFKIPKKESIEWRDLKDLEKFYKMEILDIDYSNKIPDYILQNIDSMIKLFVNNKLYIIHYVDAIKFKFFRSRTYNLDDYDDQLDDKLSNEYTFMKKYGLKRESGINMYVNYIKVGKKVYNTMDKIKRNIDSKILKRIGELVTEDNKNTSYWATLHNIKRSLAEGLYDLTKMYEYISMNKDNVPYDLYLIYNFIRDQIENNEEPTNAREFLIPTVNIFTNRFPERFKNSDEWKFKIKEMPNSIKQFMKSGEFIHITDVERETSIIKIPNIIENLERDRDITKRQIDTLNMKLKIFNYENKSLLSDKRYFVRVCSTLEYQLFILKLKQQVWEDILDLTPDITMLSNMRFHIRRLITTADYQIEIIDEQLSFNFKDQTNKLLSWIYGKKKNESYVDSMEYRNHLEKKMHNIIERKEVLTNIQKKVEQFSNIYIAETRKDPDNVNPSFKGIITLFALHINTYYSFFYKKKFLYKFLSVKRLLVHEYKQEYNITDISDVNSRTLMKFTEYHDNLIKNNLIETDEFLGYIYTIETDLLNEIKMIIESLNESKDKTKTNIDMFSTFFY